MPLTFSNITELKDWLNIISQDLPSIDFDFINIDQFASFLSERDLFIHISKACIDNSIYSPDWGVLSGRVLIQQIINTTPSKFSECTLLCKNILQKNYFDFVTKNAKTLDAMVDLSRNDKFTAMGVETLKKSYLIHVKDENEVSRLVENPQFLYMRVATFLFMNTGRNQFQDIKQIYDDLSMGYYTHATPTMFNAGLVRHQLSSCFLKSISDNVASLSDDWRTSATISQNSGGLGIYYGEVRHSTIGQNGQSKGIAPWLKVQEAVLNVMTQGGKRAGSGAMYLNEWHKDSMEFIEMRREFGTEDQRARKLFYALMISDMFMRKVKNDENVVLFCPHLSQKYLTKLLGKDTSLTELWGRDFDKAYKLCEEGFKNGKLDGSEISARKIWNLLKVVQREEGMPFVLYKDSCNRKSNQRNRGTIKCSNLCTEILEYSSRDEIASCNLATISLPHCVKFENDKPYFDFNLLEKITRQLVRNVNRVVDCNYYPPEIPEIKKSNDLMKPIGLGVQGLANAVSKMDYCWVDETGKKPSNEMIKLNHDIFETMYFAAVSESVKLAAENGKPYEKFEGSPASKGLFQFDLWDMEAEMDNYPDLSEDELLENYKFKPADCSRYNWEELRNEMTTFGMANSLLIALPPTASTAQILGNNECFEMYHEIIGSKELLSGTFTLINNDAYQDLVKLDLWDSETVRTIIRDKGSMQNVEFNRKPTKEQRSRLAYLKRKYLTVWEVNQRIPAQLAIERAKFIDQTQSFNCFIKDPTHHKLDSFHFYMWENKAKTGMYYLRSDSKADTRAISLSSINIPTKKIYEPCSVCSA